MSPKDFDDYVDEIIGTGTYSSELKKMNFTDRKQTSYLEAVKYNADLVWNEYQYNEYNLNQDLDPKLALVNTDVLNNALLSLHPPSKLKEKDISKNSMEALKSVNKFRDLILLKEYNNEDHADTQEEEIEAAVSNKEYGIEFDKTIIDAPVRSSAMKRNIATFDQDNVKTYVKADFKEIEDTKPAEKKTKKNVVFREDLSWIFSDEDDYMIEAGKDDNKATDDHLEKSSATYDDDFSEDFNSQAVSQENQDGQSRSARLNEKTGGKGRRYREEQDEGNKKKPWNSTCHASFVNLEILDIFLGAQHSELWS